MKHSIVRTLLFILLIHTNSYAEELFDVETLAYHRQAQYPSEPYKQIVVFSAPRTGSSLVYNVFRFVFEQDSKLSSFHNAFNQDCVVLRTHRFVELDSLVEQNTLYVFVIRNPLDACISNYRICTRQITDLKLFAKQLVYKHGDYLARSQKLKSEGRNVVILKYEDFATNLEYLFEFIENHFSISIASNDKDLMREGFSKENIYECTKLLQDFKEYLPISGFHGQHVLLNKYSPPKKFFYWLNVYLEEIKPVFRNYGYFNP